MTNRSRIPGAAPPAFVAVPGRGAHHHGPVLGTHVGLVPGRVERVAETLRTTLRHHTRAGAA